MNDKNDPITWLQVHNLLPIVSIALAFIGGWVVFTNRVTVLETEVDNAQAKAEACYADLNEIRGTLINQGLDIRELQSKTEVKGVSTQPLPTFTPTPEVTQDG